MTQRLADLVDQFCQCQRKQRGKTDGGVTTYRWNLTQFLEFVRAHNGRLARVPDLTPEMIQAWMDDMAAVNVTINTPRCWQASLSSFCNWLVKRTLGRLEERASPWEPARDIITFRLVSK